MNTQLLDSPKPSPVLKLDAWLVMTKWEPRHDGGGTAFISLMINSVAVSEFAYAVNAQGDAFQIQAIDWKPGGNYAKDIEAVISEHAKKPIVLRG